jgi:cell division septation protein DedD
VALAILAFALYWQTQWDTDVLSELAPEAPESHFEAFALKFQPKRTAERVPLAPAADQTAEGVAMAPAAEPAGPGVFAIDVALFSSSARASRVRDQLIAAGYRAYIKDLDLGDRGRLYEVVVGPFALRAETDAVAARIRAIPGFADARILSSAP